MTCLAYGPFTGCAAPGAALPRVSSASRRWAVWAAWLSCRSWRARRWASRLLWPAGPWSMACSRPRSACGSMRKRNSTAPICRFTRSARRRRSDGRLVVGSPAFASKLAISDVAASFQGQDGAGVAAGAPLLAVVEKMPERGRAGAKGDLFPRNLRLLEQRHFQAFRSRGEIEIEQPRAVKNVHLVDLRHRQHAEQIADLDARIGFLQRLAQRRFARGLAVFHEARGRRPVAAARLDGALAQQDFALPLRDAADHHFGIRVVNGVAGLAHVAREAIAGGYLEGDGSAAVGAKFHRGECRGR